MQRSFGTQISGNRRPGAELSEVARAGIIAESEAGVSKLEIAAEYRVNRSTVYDTINRWKNHHTLESLPRPGQPEKLTRHQKRLLIRIVRRNPQIDYAALKCQVAGVTVTHKTLYRLLKKYHITNWRARKRPKLTPAVARLRLRWARKYKGFPWRKVKFSDECSYERGTGKKPIWVFRTSLQKWYHEFIEEVSTGKDLTQMVYAAFWYNGRSELIAMERDPLAAKEGYSARSYIWALEDGLIPIYEPLDIY